MKGIQVPLFVQLSVCLLPNYCNKELKAEWIPESQDKSNKAPLVAGPQSGERAVWDGYREMPSCGIRGTQDSWAAATGRAFVLKKAERRAKVVPREMPPSA